jgi:hypothetical protein
MTSWAMFVSSFVTGILSLSFGSWFPPLNLGGCDETYVGPLAIESGIRPNLRTDDK